MQSCIHRHGFEVIKLSDGPGISAVTFKELLDGLRIIEDVLKNEEVIFRKRSDHIGTLEYGGIPYTEICWSIKFREEIMRVFRRCYRVSHDTHLIPSVEGVIIGGLFGNSNMKLFANPYEYVARRLKAIVAVAPFKLRIYVDSHIRLWQFIEKLNNMEGRYYSYNQLLPNYAKELLDKDFDYIEVCVPANSIFIWDDRLLFIVLECGYGFNISYCVKDTVTEKELEERRSYFWSRYPIRHRHTSISHYRKTMCRKTLFNVVSFDFLKSIGYEFI